MHQQSVFHCSAVEFCLWVKKALRCCRKSSVSHKGGGEQKKCVTGCKILRSESNWGGRLFCSSAILFSHVYAMFRHSLMPREGTSKEEIKQRFFYGASPRSQKTCILPTLCSWSCWFYWFDMYLKAFSFPSQYNEGQCTCVCGVSTQWTGQCEG